MRVRRHVQIRYAAALGVVLLLALSAPAVSAGPAPGQSLDGTGQHDLYGVVAFSPTDALAVGKKLDRWDGQHWVKQVHPQGNVWSFAGVDASGPEDVWAVGSRFKVGLGYQPLVAHWDGTSWQRANNPDGNPNGGLYTAVSEIGPGDVWAVGHYTIDEGASIALAEHWDGSTWTLVSGSGAHVFYSVLAFSDTDVWAAAEDDGIYHWNGRTWKSYTPHEDIESVSGTGPNDVWAVGGPYPHTFAEHWDGHTWTVTPTPDGSANNSRLVSVSAVSPDDVWAVGGSSDVVGEYVSVESLMEHWDGQQWSLVHVPNPGRYKHLNSISMDSATDGYAVGRYTNGIDHNTGRLMYLHWDGTQWTRTRA